MVRIKQTAQRKPAYWYNSEIDILRCKAKAKRDANFNVAYRGLYETEINYKETSTKWLSSGVTEHFILSRFAKLKAEKIQSGVGKTL